MSLQVAIEARSRRIPFNIRWQSDKAPGHGHFLGLDAVALEKSRVNLSESQTHVNRCQSMHLFSLISSFHQFQRRTWSGITVYSVVESSKACECWLRLVQKDFKTFISQADKLAQRCRREPNQQLSLPVQIHLEESFLPGQSMEMSANSCWSWEWYWKRLWAIKCPSCHRIRPVAQACSPEQWSLKANWKNFAVRDWCAFRIIQIIQRNWQPCVHREWIGKLWNHHATCPEKEMYLNRYNRVLWHSGWILCKAFPRLRYQGYPCVQSISYESVNWV